MRVQRGDRLGLIGPNGAGKSTLIKLFLGQLEPDSGSIRLGTNVQVAYFDQMREQLDPDKSVAETISPGSDWIEIGSERKHVTSYLGDFLFAPQRAGSPVKALSGGERNRLLLARLFARTTNVLVMDEPTNDLDIESLELLEQALQDYAGTLLLVSHDRAFLDNVVTQTLVAEGNGKWQEYVGGYSDWLEQRPAASNLAAPKPKAESKREAAATAAPAKMSFKETRELAQLPQEIEALEQEQNAITQRMSSADYHKQGAGADQGGSSARRGDRAGAQRQIRAMERAGSQGPGAIVGTACLAYNSPCHGDLPCPSRCVRVVGRIGRALDALATSGAAPNTSAAACCLQVCSRSCGKSDPSCRSRTASSSRTRCVSSSSPI